MHPRSSGDLRPLSVAMISTYPPTRCGIGRFTRCLCEAWTRVAAGTDIVVARIATTADSLLSDARAELIFDPSSPVACRNTARHVSQSDVVVLQHEYGLFGPDDGIAVLDLVSEIEAPLISVIHTVRTQPTSRQRHIIEELGRAGTLVVLSRVARSQLIESYDVDPSAVVVIPHGSLWRPAHPTTSGPRRRLITWGLLGPGKGIERALEAMSLIDVDPPITYDIVGQTHPKVLAQFGQAYRHSLENLAHQLGVGNRVRFIDRYVSDRELEQMVAAADLVLIPYDNDEQVTSGVLTDAVAIGRPVVATPFPHAIELASSCGKVAGREPADFASAIEQLLVDDQAYARAVYGARKMAPSLTWEGVAAAYDDLASKVAARPVVA